MERQLRILDEMEREERDPERLAALFQLDHLAARLRRNDENLLVLAGGQMRRRADDDDPGVPLDGVVLAALSEVESYQRIRSDVEDGTPVSGHAAPDLIHLLAELFDNATAFSPPDSPVCVTCETDEIGTTLQITDEGIGLAPGALLEANALLKMPPDLSIAASERMGLVVVSHLAARHQIRVSLSSSSAGTSASVRIPGDLLFREGKK
ncbi:ATP-binding protein [Allorhizocola rhizosphaerae]|uniref:ATP-binding protein n=1 Tax=Allorhizocola rhizosphaerae TaxID=1872709 RepID=UPI0013C355E4|nr:ATP-binding protein [Allorhizocola rhizosphaerae]